jgi:hypothetical protein
MRKILIVFGLILMSIQLYAQSDSLELPIKYYADFQLGILSNCIECGGTGRVDMSVQMTHGVSINQKYLLGIGVGRESYGRIISRPVVLHAERFYKGFTGQYGFSLDTGIGFLKEGNNVWSWFGELQRGRAFILHPQFVFTAGEKKTKMLISVGYKIIRANLTYDNWGLPTWVDMDLNRFNVNIGFRIN